VVDTRATAAEFLDRPDCELALAAESYRFMERVNRRFGGIRVVRRFLEAETAGRQPSESPLRILDIGSGSCDIPQAISRWSLSRGLPLHITCLELSGHAVGLARERFARVSAPDMDLLQEDAFAHQPAQPYDFAVASMCFHHFSNAQILMLLQKLRAFVKRSVLINDLRRSRVAVLATAPLLVGASAGLKHDVRLSIRRGFKISELRALLQQLDSVSVAVEPALWFRIAAVIRFNTGESA
jgi:phospholipid N-methyltransferase